jgi:cytidylate kinase
MNSPMQQNTRISAVAERQMRNWGQIEETAARAVVRYDSQHLTGQAVSFVTISREAGAGGATVARLLGGQLGWNVYDGNLLDEISVRHKEPRLMLDLVDETESNWVYDVLGTWMDRHIVTHEKYVAQITRLVHVLARTGKAVFVGRGVQFLLPRSRTFTVRIVASEAFRAQRVGQGHNVSLPEALAAIRRTDRGRRDFICRFFHHDIGDPHLYDMIINAEQFGLAGAAEQIVHAVRRTAAQVS